METQAQKYGDWQETTRHETIKMSATPQSAFPSRRHSDGFTKIPLEPRQVYILQAHQVLYHLPTKLATHRRDLWRIPWLMEDICKDDVVILWQGGARGGIYGIAVPDGEPFVTTDAPSLYRQSCLYQGGTQSIKLHCVYVLAKPLVGVDLRLHFRGRSVIRRGISKLAYRVSPKEWKTIYQLLKLEREKSAAVITAASTDSVPGFNVSIDIEDSVIAALQVDDLQTAASTSDVVELDILAYQIWSLLTQAAEANKRVHADALSAHLNVSIFQVRECLDLIENICNGENWPSLASLTHPHPNEGYAESRDSNVIPIAGQQFEFERENGLALTNLTNLFAWNAIPNPFNFALEATTDQLVQRLLEKPYPDESSAVYRLVKVRGAAQKIFAKLMRRIYDDQCAFCGLSIAPALEAAHIKPWPFCTPAERLLPSNGLLLCAGHHKLFDSGVMHLTQYHNIEVLDSFSLPAISIADDQLRRLGGVRAHLPREKAHYPSAEFLNFRRAWVERIYGS